MFDWFNFYVLAIIGTGLQFGGLIYFALVFTPMIFRFQEAAEATKFLGKVFPFFYRINAAFSIFPALMLFPGRTFYIEVSTLLGVSAVFLFKARILCPMVDAARVGNNKIKFKILHRVSVLIYGFQIIAIFIILLRLIADKY